MDILEFAKMLIEIVQGLHGALETAHWAANAALDLFLHAGWSGCASLAGLLLAYWAVRGLYFVLAPKVSGGGGLGWVITRRAVSLCVLAQFAMDTLGHAYAVFRQDLPVTLENLGKYAARDFHCEAWCLSGLVCLIFGVYLVIRMRDALRPPDEDEDPVDSLPARLDDAMRRFSYTVALFASLSAHCWWDRMLGPF